MFIQSKDEEWKKMLREWQLLYKYAWNIRISISIEIFWQTNVYIYNSKYVFALICSQSREIFTNFGVNTQWTNPCDNISLNVCLLVALCVCWCKNTTEKKTGRSHDVKCKNITQCVRLRTTTQNSHATMQPAQCLYQVQTSGFAKIKFKTVIISIQLRQWCASVHSLSTLIFQRNFHHNS